MTDEELLQALEAASDRPHTGIFQCDGRFGTKRNDLHAFMLLESILPGAPNKSGYIMNMVGAAEHDRIYLDVDLEKLAEVITQEQIEELESCGVHADENDDGLSMFV
ncbi:hypothetical protein [Mesorhizobium sp. M8A.F.Ca.ET.021.01.1.1]|uniref:hypothetical protein n=1 Tax=Mesorhizobium sp. M8A.F.Ca.ET.021.01.1.1 TaxID=2496757 RepID=UPI000FCA804A|nr:hypothetical protein [Mesorhizobium sp. M8A.F.Ca.ET.021.01.1.1]RUW56371.1 hypothetical protein EOA36_04490 [Mesorhizobium sp. M8A.F.Ca.ET.021.01.1.1]